MTRKTLEKEKSEVHMQIARLNEQARLVEQHLKGQVSQEVEKAVVC